MRILSLFLTVLLASQLGLPYPLCRVGDSCHASMQAKARVGETTEHHCCALEVTDTSFGLPCDSNAAQEQEREDHNCQDNCSCNCCRPLVNIFPVTVVLSFKLTPPSTNQPTHQSALYLRELAAVIWEPPRSV